MINEQPASIFRRVAAFVYDCLLLIAVFFVVTAVAVRINGGEAIGSPLFFYLFVLVPVALLFFSWFWMHGGQTLGMRAWKIKAVNEEGESLSLRASVIRFVSGLVLLPVVLLPALADKHKRGLHDRLANTRIVLLKQNQNNDL